jgi:hypothetical protein
LPVISRWVGGSDEFPDGGHADDDEADECWRSAGIVDALIILLNASQGLLLILLPVKVVLLCERNPPVWRNIDLRHFRKLSRFQ